MSVRAHVKSLVFHDGKTEWWGDYAEHLDGWSAKFQLALHGDDAVYRGIVTTTPYEFESGLDWDKVPPGDRRFLGNLERFVDRAVRMSVYIRLVVVKPVNLDEVEEEYLAEEEEEKEEEDEP